MVLWGESIDSARTLLLENGIPEKDANALIRRFRRERTNAIRLKAVKKGLLGLLVILIGIGLGLLYGYPSAGNHRGWAVVAVIIGFGLWKVIDGAITFLFAKLNDRDSLTAN